MNNGGTQGQRPDRAMNEIVREAGKYYDYLKKKDINQTRLDVVVVSGVVWFSSFVVLGLTSLALSGCFSPSTFSACVSSTSGSKVLFQFLLISAAACTAIAAGAGVTTYAIRRKRRYKFEELNSLLAKMKTGQASSEDGIHLMDAVHQAALVIKKRKVDSAFEYGLIAFGLVGLLGSNLFAGILVGVLAYLYFRQKALREYEKEDKRYEDSKFDLLQSL